MPDAFARFFAQSGRPALLGAFGESVVYYAAAGSSEGVALQASVGHETLADSFDGEGMVRRRERFATISADPASPQGGVAAPREEAEIGIGGERWTVEAVEALSGSMARLRLVRPVAKGPDKPGERFRRQ